MTVVPALAVIASHGTHEGGNPTPLVVFLGVVATVVWLVFSRWRWRNTVLVAAGGWIVGLAATVAL